MSGAAGAAFGILGAGLPLMAGFVVLDAAAGMVKCSYCGEEMHGSKQQEHMTGAHRRYNESEDFDLTDIDRSLGF